MHAHPDLGLLTYLSLCVMSQVLMRLFERDYENSLWYDYKLFSVSISIIAYENRLIVYRVKYVFNH